MRSTSWQLDTLFQLADNLENVAKGEKLNAQLAARLALAISEISLPRAPLSGAERNALAFGYWTRETYRLRAEAQSSRGNRQGREQSGEAEGDSRLAGAASARHAGRLQLCNYAPPGAQILLTNPVFVRGHDFLGMQGANHTWKACEMMGSGWPSNAGGRLMGSLAGLPYALAEAEQNFLIPTQTQALIWGDLVPQMILSAKIPRWWNVTPAQIHIVGLRMRHAQDDAGRGCAEPGGRGSRCSMFSTCTRPRIVPASCGAIWKRAIWWRDRCADARRAL